MKTKLIILAITTSLLLNTGAIKVHANSNFNPGWITQTIYISPSESIETKLNVLLALNIISNNQKVTILDIYYKDEITTKQDMQNQLNNLVKKNIINQNQEQIILNLFI
jgi:hypothetical protein